MDLICSWTDIAGAECSQQGVEIVPSLLIELPHGATNTAHFQRYRDFLLGSFPDQLEDFFHVNTDIGTPECAAEIAAAYVKIFPSRRVRIIRCHIPRTFIDCNRVIDAQPDAFQQGKVTPGIPSYVTNQQDQQWLQEQYYKYHSIVRGEVEQVGNAGGSILFLHSYAPKTVGIQTVDESIVQKLHWAYSEEMYSKWPLRPEIDVICRDLDGNILVDQYWLDTLSDALTQKGYQVAKGESYPLHPVTMAHHYWKMYPKQTLCLEVRRDLLVDEFTPFSEMAGSAKKMKKIAEAIAATIPS